jgi:sensor histidine kinase YesM
MLPALTIQPLVENSIRHGVRGIKDPSIYITTRRDSEEHMIEIRDNGRGFDTTDESRMSGRHIGISNVRERVEKMCGGRVDVESSPGKGCTVTIHIPVKRET